MLVRVHTPEFSLKKILFCALQYSSTVKNKCKKFILYRRELRSLPAKIKQIYLVLNN